MKERKEQTPQSSYNSCCSRGMVSVIFDLEGTLVRTVEMVEEVILDFRRRTREKLIDIGIPAEVLAGVDTSTLMRNRATRYASANLSGSERLRFEQELDRFLLGYELSWAKQSTLFSDTMPALNRLREQGIRMAIVTNTSRQAAEAILAKHALSQYFDVVVTRSDVAQLKPDPEGILRALRKLQDRESIFVGDTEHDSEAARNAGIKSIKVRRGWRHSLLGSDSSGDYMAKSLSDILKIIR